MNVLEEYVVKMKNQTSRKGINLVYFLFWTSLYQLICVGSLFWLDILPWYGNVDNISEFGRKYVIFFYNFICSLAPSPVFPIIVKMAQEGHCGIPVIVKVVVSAKNPLAHNLQGSM